MGCCHAKKSYSKELNTYLAKPTPVGNCKITYLPYLDTPAGPLKKRNDQATHDWVAENVEEIGRFEMQCRWRLTSNVTTRAQHLQQLASKAKRCFQDRNTLIGAVNTS